MPAPSSVCSRHEFSAGVVHTPGGQVVSDRARKTATACGEDSLSLARQATRRGLRPARATF
jgi:hypothetical protein